MRLQLKPIREQVMVITGATSGIGLVTARRAARRGARLVLVARNVDALERIADEINSQTPGRAIAAPADVSHLEDVESVVETARREFGGFDTWVNAAAVSIYGTIMQISLEDHRRLFEVNYWGYVYASRLAVEELAEQGGALINVGSVLSDRAIPEQGPYCASKHAVKGFTDALRMELEERGVPVSVTLIKPAAIDTPYKDHAKNHFEVKPKNPPPVYAPDLVANAILHCARYPRRDIVIGGGGKLVSTIGSRYPRVTDLVMERTMARLQKTDRPVEPGAGDRHSLYEPMDDGDERGRYDGLVRETSFYTTAMLHPLAATAVAAGAALALGAAWRAATSPASGRKRLDRVAHAFREGGDLDMPEKRLTPRRTLGQPGP